MTLKDFIDKYNGKFVDFDGVYGPQCFDLYRQYCKEYLNVPQSPATGSQGAKLIWTTYLKGYFDAIPNTPLGVPLPGDIIIWGEGIGPYGHVAICWDAGVMTFHSFDQNFPTGSPCHIQQHSYKGVLGWLRRKPIIVQDTLPKDPTPTVEPPQTSPEPITDVPEPETIVTTYPDGTSITINSSPSTVEIPQLSSKFALFLQALSRFFESLFKKKE